MPVLSESIIQSVKSNTSIISVLKSHGIPVIRKGKGYFAVCPFHKHNGSPEKTPSLSIDPVKKLYHCFSCDARGNVIQLVQELENLGFRESVHKLLALKPEPEKPAAKEKKIPALSPEERQEIVSAVMKDAEQCLRNSRPGREYLEGRGLNPLGLLKHYDIGFWEGLYGNLNNGDRGKLAATGFFRGTAALFNHCVIFGLKNGEGFTTVYGRRTDGDGHYMLPGARQGLFLPHQGLAGNKPVIITESIIDGLSLFTAGFTNVLPLLGVNGFLPDHLAYLKEQAFPRIFIVLDGDEAGNRAAVQLQENLKSGGLDSEILTLPDGKDINDMLQEWGENKLKAWCTERLTDRSGSAANVRRDEESIYMTMAAREYRVRGLTFFGLDRLRVNVKAYGLNNRHDFYIDTVDLYQSRGREGFITQAAESLKAERKEIQAEVQQLITVLEEERQAKKRLQGKPAVPELTEAEKKEALAYLKSPNLLERIRDDFKSCGMVGNERNNLLAYLGSLSRLTERPFGVLIVSRSGAGKSYLQDMVSGFVPPENLLQLTRLTGQSLFYLSKNGLKHKLLSIEEDEGMQDAMYSIRVLLSSQKLRLHGLKTDSKSGEFTCLEKVVEGPAGVMITTTDLSRFDHETRNRFFVLFLDESREQTERILAFKRRAAGPDKLKLKHNRQRLQRLHQNIQRMLKPLTVRNQLGTGVKYPTALLNTRREDDKLETLISTVALLHQYQREIKEERVFGIRSSYMEVHQSDIDAVLDLAKDVLGQSLDELSPLCRELLLAIHELVEEHHRDLAMIKPDLQRWQVTFTRKELRERTSWSVWHLRQNLRELVELGFITPRLGKKGQMYSYSLVEDIVPPVLKFTK